MIGIATVTCMACACHDWDSYCHQYAITDRYIYARVRTRIFIAHFYARCLLGDWHVSRHPSCISIHMCKYLLPYETLLSPHPSRIYMHSVLSIPIDDDCTHLPRRCSLIQKSPQLSRCIRREPHFVHECKSVQHAPLGCEHENFKIRYTYTHTQPVYALIDLRVLGI